MNRVNLVRMLVVAALVAAPLPSWAQTEPTAVAARLFREGKSAFDDGDYRHAAERFEEAYRTAPHPFALWNAARSWDKAGDAARAVQLYDEYLDRFPTGPDADAATKARAALEPKVARLVLPSDAWPDGIRVDGKTTEATRLVVAPGAHTIEGKRGVHVAHADVTVAGGETVRVVLAVETAPPPPPPVAPPAPVPPPPPPPATEEDRKPWSPIVVWIAGGATLAAAGVTTFFGVETIDWKSSHYDPDPSKGNLDSGKSRELATNVALGVTGALALFTAVSAIVLVDWKPKSVALAPGGVAVELP